MEDEMSSVKYKKSVWKKETIIKDAVHGYISIPKPIMQEIIDTEIFQRLKNIEQTGMEALYPSATHNRFTHSLGVYHLSKMAFAQFRKNVKSDFESLYDEIKNRYVNNNAGEVWDRWQLMFQLASLLHDCGHSPFSHTLEFIYDLPIDKTLNDRLTENMNQLFKEDIGYIRFKETGNKKEICGAPHERMSAFFIKTSGSDFFKDRVERLLKDYVSEFMNVNIYHRNKDIFEDDIEFMVRMIIGCRYDLEKAEQYPANAFYDKKANGWQTELQLRNCIINMLNSKLDVDNLDYVIRDCKYSGYANQMIDVERLLSSLTIVTAFKLEDVPLEKEKQLNCCVNLTKFEGDHVDARISGACFIKSHFQDIKAYGNIELEGGEKRIVNDIMQRSIRTGERFSAQVVFPSEEVHNEVAGAKIAIYPLCRSYKENKLCYLHIRGCLQGKFSGTILQNEVDIPDEWKDHGKRIIIPAYFQNSMSVLMSAIEGSNFEKKWVYSHQISTFINNFLHIYLLEKYAEILTDKELKIYDKDLDQLVKGLKLKEHTDCLCLEEETSRNPEDLHKKLEEKLKSSILIEEQEELQKYLHETYDRHSDESLLELLECLTTYKKVYGKRHEGLKNLISNLVKFHQTLEESAIKDLADFNQKNIRLRGREVQYFWDIVAMCESKTIMDHHFYRSSDEDLIALYKQEFLSLTDQECLIKTNDYQEFTDCFEYLTKRNFMKCMWKSYPEYEFYFQDWPKEERNALNNFLKPHSVPEGFEYLVLSDMIGDNRASIQQKEFWKYLKEEFSLKRFVSVNQMIKTKQFVPYETYMKRGSQVVRLEDIGLFSNVKKDEKFCFFYYEQISGGREIDIVEILDWLRKKIKVDKKKDENGKGELKKDSMEKDVIIRDNIYGNIYIPYKIKCLVDCKEFQRLRRISQLATAGQVFPGAVQNRFSHSLGVYHLMDLIVKHFEEKLRKIGYEDSITPRDKDAILAAALLHDIGHGPFSHTFEDAGINKDDFDHEYWTRKIITSTTTDIHETLTGLWDDEFPDLVMSYIDCRNEAKDGKIVKEEYSSNGLNLKFIFASLVSSQLDADRMDYLLRDSKACGVTYGQFDLEHIIQGMSIAINASGELKVGIDEEYQKFVEEYLYARYLMYNNIYYHPFKLFTEKLLQNILREACSSYINGSLKSGQLPQILAEIFNHSQMHLEDFCKLDDHVVMGSIQIWAGLTEKENQRLAQLCKFFLNRRGYDKLNIFRPQNFCDKLFQFTKYSGAGNITDKRSKRYDFIYCKKQIQMYKSDGKGEVYLIKRNGTIDKFRNLTNLEDEEIIIYYSEELTKEFYPDDAVLIKQLLHEYDINNSVEIEKKFVIEQLYDPKIIIDNIKNIATDKGYHFQYKEVVSQEDTYFDTYQKTLMEQDFSVRIRKRGGVNYITCKYKMPSESNGEGSQLERFESERKIKSDFLKDNIEHIEESVIKVLKDNNYGPEDLSACIQVRNERTKYMVTKEGGLNGRIAERYELVLDNVTYSNLQSKKEKKEIQIEIELKSAYETRINMKAFTDEIEKIQGLTSITGSKYQRAVKFTKE